MTPENEAAPAAEHDSATQAGADQAMHSTAPEAELVDAAVEAATPVLEDAAVSLRDKLVAEGHALIDRHLSAAKRLSDLQPAVRPLLPVIAACLHDLFAHMTSAPQTSSEAPSSSAGTTMVRSPSVDHAATAAVQDPAPEVAPAAAH